MRMDHGEAHLIPPGSYQKPKVPREKKIKRVVPGRPKKHCGHNDRTCVCVIATSVFTRTVKTVSQIRVETTDVEGD